MRLTGVAVAFTFAAMGCSPGSGTAPSPPPADTSNSGGGPSASGGASEQGGAPSSGGDGSFGAVGNVAKPDGGGHDCGGVSINTSVEETDTPGNVLIVFDESDSMSDDFGGKPKWLAASDALVAALAPTGNSVNVAAIFSPSVQAPQTPPRRRDV